MSAENVRACVDVLPDEDKPTDGQQLARCLVRRKQLTAFQAEQVYKGRGKALVLGNYTVLEKLGQGGMGMVLKAQHRRMKRLVALKVLSPDVTKSPDLVARFQREVQAAARLEHANIVTAYDADEAHGTHFLVMQYVDGNDLSAIVKKQGPLPIDRAVECIIQAARGLEFAHQQNVFHRDIKPANLLLDREGTVKILDMGLARIDGDTGTQAELTNTGAVMGTVDYMAPEQAMNTKAADARSDQYSLGITLWYLLTARPTFDGDSLMSRLLAHREAPIPSLKAARGDVPLGLDEVFQKMIAKRPENRYPTMTATIEALQQCLLSDASPPSLSSVRSEDSKLNEFLAGLERNGKTKQVAMEQTLQAVSVPTNQTGEADYEPTVTIAAASSETNATVPIAANQATPIVQHRPAKKRRKKQPGGTQPKVAQVAAPWLSDRRVQISGALMLMLLTAPAIFFLLPSDDDPRSDEANAVDTLSKPADGSSQHKQQGEINDGVSESSRPGLASDWTSLFNGRDLSGWTPQGFNGWRVEGGVLIGEPSSNSVGWLMSTATFADYELELEYNIAAGGNSGIFPRAFPGGFVTGRDFGEVQLLDEAHAAFKSIRPEQKTGAIYGRVAPDQDASAPPNTWNQVSLRIEGQQVAVTINGVKLASGTDSRLKPRGNLGIQLHTGEIRLRNIRIRQLP